MYQSKGFSKLPRADALEQKVSKMALEELFTAMEHNAPRMRGAMVMRGGKVIGEKIWHPYQPEDKVWVYSLSKSFTSTAVGLAVTEGLLSLEDKVISFFPEKCPDEVSDNLAKMRLWDLLTMTSGHHDDTTLRMAYAEGGDWVKTFLSLPVEHEPGSWFCYNSGATFMAMAILQKATGEKALDYMAPRLFEPLGFDDVEWDENPMGIATGGWGFFVRLEDAAKLGQLYLNKGIYNGKRILSEEWVEQASKKQVDNSENPSSKSPDWIQGYGFQLWQCRHGAFRGDGAFGQYIVVLPEQDAVVACMGEMADMQDFLNVIWDKLLPAFDAVSSPMEQSLSGKQYKLDENTMGLETVALVFEPDSIACHFTVKENEKFVMRAGRNDWMDNEAVLPFGHATILISAITSRQSFHKQSIRCSWVDENTLKIDVLYRQSPHADCLKFRFSNDSVELSWPLNMFTSQVPNAEEITVKGTCRS